MASVAVVGGTAALARYLLPCLEAHGHSVVTLGRTRCDVLCDLLDDGPVSLPEGVDAVVHLAALSRGSGDTDLQHMAEVNSLGALKVAMGARAAGARHMVLVSTQYVQLKPDSRYYGMYPVTKRCAEEMVGCYCALHDIPLTVLRPSQIYDDRGLFSVHQPLLYLMADRAEAGEEITIHGRNDARRNYIHARDVAEVMARVVERGVTGVFPVGFPRDCSLSEMADHALRAFGSRARATFLRDRESIPDTVFGIETELYETIGYFPSIDMKTGMEMLATSRREGQDEEHSR